MNNMREAFNKLFGDMYLSESDVAFRIFEYGYKAGAAAENEACAKLCDEEGLLWGHRYAAAIRARENRND